MKFVIIILFHQTFMTLSWKIKDDTLMILSVFKLFFFYPYVNGVQCCFGSFWFSFFGMKRRKSYTFGTTCLTHKFSKVTTFSIFFLLRKWPQLSQYQVCVAGRQTKTQNDNIPIWTLIQTGNNPKRAEKHT